MDKENLFGEPDIPVDVSELGILRNVELECPGVYSVIVETEIDLNGIPVLEGYYLVLDGTPISQEARKYGMPLQNSQGIVFRQTQEDGGGKIVEYEILKYKVIHHIPLPEGETLHEFAIYAAELYPEYFGMLPVPTLTPWGYTTRHRTLENGIYWIKTDQCEEVLAVCHPVWEIELSSGVLNRARQTDCDTEHDIDNTLGYQFFTKKESCVVIFELLPCRSKWLSSGLVNLSALMNAILEYWPEYAVSYNLYEQSGLNDGAGLFLRSMGIEVELNDSVDRIISLTPGAGTDFLRW